MQYLCATYDKDFKISYPPGSREFFEMNNWLFFLVKFPSKYWFHKKPN